jgi:hypothetical protein
MKRARASPETVEHAVEVSCTFDGIELVPNREAAFCGNGKDTAGFENSRLVHLTFLRTDPVRRVNMRTDPLCSTCPVSHKTLLQRLQRTTRYTSFRVRPLHFLQR